MDSVDLILDQHLYSGNGWYMYTQPLVVTVHCAVSLFSSLSILMWYPTLFGSEWFCRDHPLYASKWRNSHWLTDAVINTPSNLWSNLGKIKPTTKRKLWNKRNSSHSLTLCSLHRRGPQLNQHEHPLPKSSNISIKNLETHFFNQCWKRKNSLIL